MQLKQIEIDFDIHQMIELERRGFEEPPYLALRRLLKLPEMSVEATEKKAQEKRKIAAPQQILIGAQEPHGRPFTEDGVVVPHGSMARMYYLRGSQCYEGQFLYGKLVVDGRAYSSLSPAASDLATTKDGRKTSLNGWLYWEAKFPGDSQWRKLKDLREKANKN